MSSHGSLWMRRGPCSTPSLAAAARPHIVRSGIGSVPAPAVRGLLEHEAGEQTVVAVPQPCRIYRYNKRPGLFQFVQQPLPATAGGQQVGPIQDRSSTVLPLPGGADTTVTLAAPASRSHSPGRETTPPAP
jgi:hypothetical protein